MADKIWITSDEDAGHTALWDPHKDHGKSGLRLRGGEVREVTLTPHIEAQMKGDNAPVRRAKPKEIEAAQAAQKQERVEAKAAEAGTG